MPEADNSQYWSVVVHEPGKGFYHYIAGQPMGQPHLKEDAITLCGKKPGEIKDVEQSWGTVPTNLQPCDACQLLEVGA